MVDEATDATETTEADEADKADVADKPGDANEAKADEANEANADEADAEADEVVEAIVTKEIDVADEAIVIDVTDKANYVEMPLLPPFSLAFFSEDKVYFGIRVDVRNNKLLMARSRDELDKLVEAEGANNNQLRGCSLSSLITWNRVDYQLGFLAENV